MSGGQYRLPTWPATGLRRQRWRGAGAGSRGDAARPASRTTTARTARSRAALIATLNRWSLSNRASAPASMSAAAAPAAASENPAITA